MAVIVNDDVPIEQALRMLWRESNREGVPAVSRDLRYFVPESEKAHALKREYKKRKRRRRTQARRNRQKHAA